MDHDKNAISTSSLSPEDRELALKPTKNLFHDIVKSRRSIRAFLPHMPEKDMLKRCMEEALLAPSSSNLQPWEYIIIRNQSLRSEIERICLNQRPVQTAPLLVALVAHTDTAGRSCRYILDTLRERNQLKKAQEDYWGRIVPWMYTQGPFGILGFAKKAFSRVKSIFRPCPSLCSRSDLRVMAHKSAALSAATFMLALRNEGYDTCPIEGFDPWRAARALKLPKGAEVCMFFAVGLRDEDGIWWDRILLPKDWLIREM